MDLSASTTYNKEDIKNEILATGPTAIQAKADVRGSGMINS